MPNMPSPKASITMPQARLMLTERERWYRPRARPNFAGGLGFGHPAPEPGASRCQTGPRFRPLSPVRTNPNGASDACGNRISTRKVSTGSASAELGGRPPQRRRSLVRWNGREAPHLGWYASNLLGCPRAICKIKSSGSRNSWNGIGRPLPLEKSPALDCGNLATRRLSLTSV